MADRVFAGLLLAVALFYVVVAFTVIKAPFQYDPLGPETWPRILGVLAAICTLSIMWRPDVASMNVELQTWLRLAALVAMLALYAWAFQPAGFVIATFGFCVALSIMLGAGLLAALVFGAASGILGYVLGVVVLDLNLPAGLLEFLE